MDLKFLTEIFKNVSLKRNASFSTIGYLNLSNVSDMLIFIKQDKYLELLYEKSNISAVITTEEYADRVLQRTNCGVLVTNNPERAFYMIHNYLCRETTFYKKKSFPTIIEANSNISAKAIIAENNVVIGENVIIEPGAVIGEGVSIGNNCVIGANTVIGTRGFQYYRFGDDAFYIEHIGGVIIENNVEILSGSCIAKGLITPTRLCENTKIDNLVHVGHSACLGKRVLVAAGAIIGGSTIIGERVWIGINSVLSASIHIGDDAFICMGAVVTKNVSKGQKVSGNFAIDHNKQIEFIKKIS